MRRLLTPRWIAGHFLAIVGIVAFISLGFWQLRRLEDRRAFNDAVEAAIASEIMTLDDALAAGGEYFRVRVTGTFETEAEVLVLRSRNQVSGYHILTPLLSDEGRGVLVDRGWVPIELDQAPVTDAPPPEGPVEIVGILWPPQDGGGDLEVHSSVVRRIDPDIVDPLVAADLIDPYLVLEAPVPDGLPFPAGAPELTEGSHLSYAVQWFLFAAVVVVGYPILLRRTARS